MSSAESCPLPKTVKDIGSDNESHLNTKTAVLLLVMIFACSTAALAFVYYSFPHLDPWVSFLYRSGDSIYDNQPHFGFQVRGGSREIPQVHRGRETVGLSSVKIQGQVLPSSFGRCLCHLLVSPDICHSWLDFPLHCLRIPISIHGSFAPYLLLFRHRSLFLLPAQLLGWQKVGQEIFAWKVGGLGQQSGETKRQSPGIHYLFTHYSFLAQLVHKYCFTCIGRPLETLLDRDLYWRGASIIHRHSSRNNTSTINLDDRRFVFSVCGTLSHLCFFEHFARLVEK